MAGTGQEAMPLLPTDGVNSSSSSKQRHEFADLAKLQETEKEYWEEEDEDYEADEKFLTTLGKKRNTSLILSDAVMLVVNYLQVFAFLQSMGLRWPWPEAWLKALRYLFFINLDVWEFMKLEINGTYTSVQKYNTNTAVLPFSYWYILAGWGCLLFLALLAYIISYLVINHKQHPFMFVQIARLQRVYIIFVQLIAIPVGLVIARLFHCNIDDDVDVDNSLICFQGIHWALIGPAFLITVLIYIVFPTWLIMKTNREILNMTPDRHEAYLQLKETEYVRGLDILWAVASFNIFSSFKKYGAHLRATDHILKAAMLIIYASLFYYIFAQALLVNVILFAMMLAFIILRPYRVPAFNYFLFLSYLCLVVNCMMGSLVASFDSFSLRSVWLTPQYMLIILGIINGVWVLFCLIFVVYLIVRHINCCGKEPLWPTMTTRGLSQLTPNTRKFLRVVIRGRVLVERAQAIHPIFSPAHEVSRMIHVVNAYCREAEYLRDPMHDTLWNLLDDLMEVHSRIGPKSLFAESVKPSIRTTARELMKLLPAFVRRLVQREYDFILMKPVKKRMLLKMYCLGLFLNHRRAKRNRERINVENVQRIWDSKKQMEEFEVDDGYYEDMYPAREAGPSTFHQAAAVTVVINEEKELDDDMVIEEAEQWAANHPVSPQNGHNNLGFTEDDLMLEDESVNLSQMMEGIPSRPTTASRQSSNMSHHQGAVAVRPGTASSRTGSLLSINPERTSSPRAGPMRPGSAASLRDVTKQPPGTPKMGSSASLRPGSARPQGQGSSSDMEGGRSTPLPGQIDDGSEEKGVSYA